MKTRPIRIREELYDLLNERKKTFGTSLSKEQGNILTIMKDIENTIGIDMRNIRVVNNKPEIKPKRLIWRL